jgi:hypothetical protein
MMNGVVERKGFWSHDGREVSPQDNLKILSGRISRSFDATPEMLYDNLSRVLQEGILKYSDRNGNVRWQWVDRLE